MPMAQRNDSDQVEISLFSEESKRLLSDSSDCDSPRLYHQEVLWRNKCRTQKWIIYFNIVLFFSSAAMFAWVVCYSHVQRAENCQANVAYSPVLSEVKLHLSLKKMDGSVIDSSHNIFRQPPSPEVDEAWNNITNLHSIWVSRSEIIRMGKDPKVVAKYPPSFGLGPDAYAAELDNFHKIHCLNYLRREIYFDYYYGDKYPDRKPSALHVAHTGHCLSMLLQHLMCDANTEIVTKDWVEGQMHPFPDFSINRMCGSFDALRTWQNSRRVANELFRPWRKPKGVNAIPVSDEFKRVFGYGEGEDGHGYQHD